MKKVFLAISSICFITITLSVAYYFVLFLPQQQRINTATLKKIEKSTKNMETNTQNNEEIQPTTNTTDMQNELDNINNSLQDEKRDVDLQRTCELNSGQYQGSGVCVYNPQN